MLGTRNLGLAVHRHWRSSRLVASSVAARKATARSPSSSSSSSSPFCPFSTSTRYSGGVDSYSWSQGWYPDDCQLPGGYATAKARERKPRSIAILGGGLTGLATAYYVTRYLPDAKVTIYEKADRLGGWIDTERVAVKTPDGKEGLVHFERGARLVKAPRMKELKDMDGLLFYDLVYRLNLVPELRFATRDTYVGRYIYYPDHLVELGMRPPSNFFKQPLDYLNHVARTITGFFTEPAFKDLFSSLRSWYKTRVPPEREPDMSVGDYLAKRFGSRSLVDNLMSAMMHGIYGGDVWKLSVDSSPFKWRKRYGHVVNGYRFDEWIPEPDSRFFHCYVMERSPGIIPWALGVSDSEGAAGGTTTKHPAWLWFRDGFTTLPWALAEKLSANPNVTIKVNESVTSLAYHPSDTVALTSATDGKPVLYDKVISTIFAGALSPLIEPGQMQTLKEIEAVSIQIVNLWYPTPGLNHPHHGFGYLIPQSVPWEQNPECALGVMFDSDREACFDPSLIGEQHDSEGKRLSADTVPGSKFTVMLGGHLLEGKELPTGQQAIDMAKSVLERHLGIPKEESARAVGSTKTCRNCIPQHFVGHRARMQQLDMELQMAFHGRLAVIGGSYQLPGVLPGLRAAYEIGANLSTEFGGVHPLTQANSRGFYTGLERAMGNPAHELDPFSPMDIADLMARVDQVIEREKALQQKEQSQSEKNVKE